MAMPVWKEPAAADQARYDPATVFEAGERNHHISNTAYPIAHNKTWGPYRISDRADYNAVVTKAYDATGPITARL
jgi:oxygen-independent coproporphyrinogen III oxidase